MFLPRKLQKRSHRAHNTQQDATSTTAEAQKQDVGYQQVEPEGSPSSARSISSSNLNETVEEPLSSTVQHGASTETILSSSEAGKLDRLVEFLVQRLSPLSLALSAREQASSGSGLVQLVSTLIGENLPCHNGKRDGAQSGLDSQPSTIHLARLLASLPGLQSRCKSISLLAEALHEAQQAQASGWFTLHGAEYQLEWSRSYIAILRELVGATSSAKFSATLAPRLVYIESIPPKLRTKSQAAAYVNDLLSSRTERGGVGVLNVLEPSVVDGILMDEAQSGVAASLEEKWIFGRGFFFLQSSDEVELLCRKYVWDLAARKRSVDEPIRCLSWTGWVEMRESYLDWRLHRQQNIERRSPLDHSTPGRKGSSEDLVEAVNCPEQNAATDLTIASNDRPLTTNDPWYRGTILLLQLPVPPHSALSLPPLADASQLTPRFCNQHLKPQLEQRVPESISYMHTYASPSADTITVAIRTTHPIHATRLITHFDTLTHLPPAAEDAYWTDLPPKVRTTAHNRFLSLEHSLTNAST